MTALNDALKVQCGEQRKRCLYTSASLFIWLRFLRTARVAFVVVPVICGMLAGWDVLKSGTTSPLYVAVLSLLAGLLPAIYAALKLDEHVPKAARLAGEYKNLEIVFADLEKVGSLKPFEEFEGEYKDARSRLEAANAEAYTAPEPFFWLAQRKIDRGDYSFEDDPTRKGSGL